MNLVLFPPLLIRLRFTFPLSRPAYITLFFPILLFLKETHVYDCFFFPLSLPLSNDDDP